MRYDSRAIPSLKQVRTLRNQSASGCQSLKKCKRPPRTISRGKGFCGSIKDSQITMFQEVSILPSNATVWHLKLISLSVNAQTSVCQARVRIHTYSDLVLDACSITQTLAIVFIFISTFCRLLALSLDPRLLLWTCLVSFVGGVAAWEWSDGKAIDEVGMTCTSWKHILASCDCVIDSATFRCQCCEIFYLGVPRVDCSHTCPQNTNGGLLL